MLDIDAELLVRRHGLENTQAGFRDHVALLAEKSSSKESERGLLEVSIRQSSRKEGSVLEVTEDVRK